MVVCVVLREHEHEHEHDVASSEPSTMSHVISDGFPAVAGTIEHDSDGPEAIAHAFENDLESDNEHGEHPISSNIESGNGNPAHDDSTHVSLQDGMLPRDLPRKTTFYDPVAERQMSQTDAKLFYQRAQLEQLKSDGFPSQTTPHGSPYMTQTPAATAPAAFGPNTATTSAAQINMSGSSLSLPSAAAKSYNLPDIEERVPWVQPSEPAPRTATRPSLGGYTTGFATPGRTNAVPSPAGYDQARPGAYPGMSLPDGAPAGPSGALTEDDPHITSELATIFKSIQKIIDIRHKYIRLSLQRDGDNPKDDPSWEIYPPPPEPAWRRYQDTRAPNTAENSMSNSTVLPPKDSAIQGTAEAPAGPDAEPTKTPKKRKQGHDIGEDFDMDDLTPLPQASEFTFRLDENGVFQVFENAEADKANTPVVAVPTIKDYYLDLEVILSISSDGPSKSFAFRRLQYLEAKYNLYSLLNEYQETADSKSVPHRDFYNVRKVDTHVHHSACMNQKHLLRFIKSKMKKCPEEVVLYRDEKYLTLAQVFQSINLTAYDLSIDTLDMHVSSLQQLLSCFHGNQLNSLSIGPQGFFSSFRQVQPQV